MSIPIELIVVGLIIVILVSVMVTGTEYTVPMFVREEFDDICNKYLAVMEKDGGLTVVQKDTLRTELYSIGLTNISIIATEGANWGEEVSMKIEGDYTFQTTDYSPNNISKSNQTKHITYENSSLNLCLN